MCGTECSIYQLALYLVSINAVAAVLIKIMQSYKYISYLV